MGIGNVRADGSRRVESETNGSYLPSLEQLEPRLLLDGALTAFQPVDPPGALIYRMSVTDDLSAAGEVDHFTVALQAGQTLTTIVEPDDPTLDVSISVLDPSSAVLAAAAGGGAGLAAWTQTTPASVDGTYAVDVTSAAGTGEYVLTAYVNAAVEEETLGGAANGALATAQSIDGSFIDVGIGAARAAVRGSLGVVASDNFESGLFGAAWTTWSSDAHGIVRTTPRMPTEIPTDAQLRTADGGFAMLMGRDAHTGEDPGDFTLNEAVWTVDLSGRTGVQLSFFHARFSDAEHLFNGAFVGHYNAAGVAINTACEPNAPSCADASSRRRGNVPRWSADYPLLASAKASNAESHDARPPVKQAQFPAQWRPSRFAIPVGDWGRREAGNRADLSWFIRFVPIRPRFTPLYPKNIPIWPKESLTLTPDTL